jgi:acetyl-CoA synthetase
VNGFSVNTVERALNPTSIAVIGASDRAFFSRTLLDNLSASFAGEIIAINPRRSEVLGRRCYPSLQKAPLAPDIVVVTVPRQQVSAAVSDAIDVGSACSIVMSSGFRESREDAWAHVENDLARRSRDADHILVGPNCLGVVLAGAGVVAMSVPFPVPPTSGKIALAMQSGGLLGTAVKQLADYGSGIRYAISVGNGTGSGIADWVRIFATRDDVCAIGLLIEELGSDWDAFASAVDLAHRSGQMIYALKVGKTSAGAAAAQSHTGAIADDYRVIAAGLAQLGVREARNYSELVMALALRERFGLPRASGLGVASTSGGTNAIIADMAAEAGLSLPTVNKAAALDLSALGTFAIAANPLDLGGNSIVELEASSTAVAGLLAEPTIGIGVYAVTSLPDPRLTGHMELLRTVGRAADAAKVPTVVAPLAPGRREAAHDDLLNSFEWLMAAPTMADALSAIALWCDGRSITDATVPTLPDAGFGDWRPSRGRQWLSELELKNRLAAQANDRGRLVAPRARMLAAPWDLEDMAASIDWPVYLKVVAPQLFHKTDAGLIRGPIADLEVARRETRSLAETVGRAGLADASLLIEESAPEGQDLIISVTARTLGMVMIVGLGGTRRDLGSDVSLMIEPVSDGRIGNIVAKYLLGSHMKFDQPTVQRARLSIIHLLRIMSETCSTEGLQVIECNPARVDSTGRVWILDALALSDE